MANTTLYYSPNYIRPVVPVQLIKYFKLDIEISDIKDCMDDFTKKFPQKQAPTLVGPDDLELTEAIAINNYIIKSSGNEEEIKKLLGTDCYIKESKNLRWESLAVSDFIQQEVAYVGPFVGIGEYDEKKNQEALTKLNIILGEYEKQLGKTKFLVGDTVMLGDLVTASVFCFGFQAKFDAAWREKYPNITRWYKAVGETPYLKEYFSNKKMVDKAITL